MHYDYMVHIKIRHFFLFLNKTDWVSWNYVQLRFASLQLLRTQSLYDFHFVCLKMSRRTINIQSIPNNYV